MARRALGPHNLPLERKRKSPKGHDGRSLGSRDSSEDAGGVIDADDADFSYGPAEAEENDRGLH
jgi:hypothetical protein